MTLDLAFLKTQLPTLEIDVFDTIDSTNEFLKKLPQKNTLHLCVAEQQTAGKGRLGKHWFSPSNCNLYFSLRWPNLYPKKSLDGLSLVIAISLTKTLQRLFPLPDLKIKWPNDLYYQDKKLAGILIEVSNESQALIIGIGLNVNMKESMWTSLRLILQRDIERNTLLSELIPPLLIEIEQFIHTGFLPYLSVWPTWDYLAGKKINVKQNETLIQGVAQGINERGHLVIEDDLGKRHTCYSGEILL